MKLVSKSLGAKRLSKLANALEKGVKAKKYKFNMGAWVGKRNSTAATKHDCGTAGCAIGYCPIVFPSLAKYHFDEDMQDWEIRFRDSRGSGSTIDEAADFFGLRYQEARNLFFSTSYSDDTGELDSSRVKVKDVVARIRERVKEMRYDNA